MSFWDFVWKVWQEDGYIIILSSFLLVIGMKGYDRWKLKNLMDGLPNQKDREDMLNTFEQIKLANTLARTEIENLYSGLKNTKELMVHLNQDISDLHKRISRTKNILTEKKKLVVIRSDDIQEAIDVLDGVTT